MNDERLLNLVRSVDRLLTAMDEKTRIRVHQELEMMSMENARHLESMQDSEFSKVH